MKNYGDLGGCYTLLDFHNSSDDTQPHSIIANENFFISFSTAQYLLPFEISFNYQWLYIQILQETNNAIKKLRTNGKATTHYIPVEIMSILLLDILLLLKY